MKPFIALLTLLFTYSASAANVTARPLEKWVSANGGSATGDCSQQFPCSTVQRALTKLGSSTNTTYTSASQSRAIIHVGPGIYTETFTVPTRQYITLELQGASLVGNMTWTSDKTLVGSGSVDAKLVIVCNDLRSMYSDAAIPLCGLTGNLTVTTTNSRAGTWRPYVHLIKTGVSGNITYDTGTDAYSSFLFLESSFYGGDVIITSGKGLAGALYAWNSNSSTSSALGGGSGLLTLSILDSVNILRPMVVSGTGGGRWLNTTFASAAHDLTGYAGTVRMDANSYESYRANVATKGSETVSMIDNATGMAYTPTTSGDWSSAPTTVLGALDNLASTRISTVGAPSGTSTANAASISGKTITLHAADGTNPGLVTTGTQTIAGAKTLSTSVSSPIYLMSGASNAGKWSAPTDDATFSCITLRSTTNSFAGTNMCAGTGANHLYINRASGSNIYFREDINSTSNQMILNTGGTLGISGSLKIFQQGAVTGSSVGAMFNKKCTRTSAGAATAVNCYPATDVPSGKAVFITAWRAQINGATPWATTANCWIEDTAGTPVPFVTIPVAAMTANAFINDNTAGLTLDNSYTLNTGGTATKGVQIRCDANGTGSDLVVTVAGEVR